MTVNKKIAAIIRELELLEVFDFYDVPLFFSAKNPGGQIFLGRFVAVVAEGSEFIYVAVSQERYRALLKGSITVSELYLNPEQAFLYRVVVFNGESVAAEMVLPEQLDIDAFPDEEERLNRPLNDLPIRVYAPREVAQRRNSDVMDISLGGEHDSQISASAVGEFLIQTQRVFEALACKQSENVKRVPEDVRNRSQLRMTTVFSGSYGLRLELDAEGHFEFPVDYDAFERLAEILEHSSDSKRFATYFSTLNLLSRARLLKLMKIAVSHGFALKVEAATPRKAFSTVALPLIRLRQNLAFIEQSVDLNRSVRTISGVLNGANVRKSEFEIQDFLTGEILRGRMAKHLVEELKVEHIELYSKVKAVVIEEVEVNEVTGTEKWINTLDSVESLDS